MKNILSSNYFKSILQLTTGSLIAQIITLIVAPISTRLYTAEQLGIYTLIITLVAMFGPVLCGKYELAIVTAKDEKEVMELIIASAMFSVIFITFITIIYRFYLFKNPVITQEVGMFAYLFIGILIVTSFINILNSYNNRYKEYKTIASVYVIRTVTQNIGLIIWGLLKFGSIGLLLSQFFSLLFGLKKQSEILVENRALFRKVQLVNVKKMLIKYKKLPLFSMPAHFLNSTSYSILNLFISSLFGLSTFGYYSMSFRILGLPLSLISMNVSKVFFQRASVEYQETGSYRNSLKQMTLLLVCIAIPMVILLLLFAPPLFELLFGNGWYVSGVFVQILAPMYGLRFIVSALSPALIVSGKQKLELFLQSLFIISSIGSYFISKIYGFDINAFLILITITYSTIYIIFFIIIYKLSKKS